MPNSFFFDSVEGDDRDYDQGELALAFKHSAESNGISVLDYPDPLMVQKMPNGDITIEPGVMLIEGYFYHNEGVDILHGGSYLQGTPRTDRVIVRLDRAMDVRDARTRVVEGSDGSTVPSDMIRDSNVYDMCLALIKWDGTTFAVEDTRGDAAICGFIRQQYATHEELQTYETTIRDEMDQLHDLVMDDANAVLDEVRGKLGDLTDDVDTLKTEVSDQLSAQNTAITDQLSAQNTAITDQLTDQNQRVDDALAKMDQTKADKAIQLTATVPASAWEGDSAPYTATVTVPGVPANAIARGELSDEATDAEYEAACDARIRTVKSTEANTVTLVAIGDKPAIPLPILVTIWG